MENPDPREVVLWLVERYQVEVMQGCFTAVDGNGDFVAFDPPEIDMWLLGLEEAMRDDRVKFGDPVAN